MLIVLNDIAFNLKYSDKYKAIKCMKQLIEVLVELRKADSGFKVCACNRLEEGELAEGYSISKLFSESEELFEKKYKSALRTFLLNPNIIDQGNGEIEYKGIFSKQCAYAYENEGVLLSISIEEFENEDVECRYYIENGRKNVILNNLSHKNHIEIDRYILPIRKYEFNPKHKINGGWGSEMDLSDEEAQIVLNKAIKAKKDSKHLIAKHNGNYYSFRQHLDICYHGYRDDSMPQNLKNKLDNIE